ncbi:regulator of G-protein signaling 10 isoform X3 [Sminthopsis crassicaudata]|uniref:regulator of G-protein signaling 10 isoform X3 n=1 Tax=Sminthopsis crassicaudata TaxID=9301 RepID=UPI003D69C520
MARAGLWASISTGSYSNTTQKMENIHDGDGTPSSSHQNVKGTAKWATSLENLLEDPEGIKRFREFLKKEFSEENVLFWLACEDFKKIQDKKQMQEKAKDIYMTFLSSKASSQVNVEGQSRLNEKILEEPHPLMFQKLQDQARLPSAVIRKPTASGCWRSNSDVKNGSLHVKMMTKIQGD